jgi:hypothetical protein
VHEVGHHFGFSDDGMEAIEASVDEFESPEAKYDSVIRPDRAHLETLVTTIANGA